MPDLLSPLASLVSSARLLRSWQIRRSRGVLIALLMALAFPMGAAAEPRIALIDSGIDLDHPDFAGRITGGKDYVDGDLVPDDTNGHGTAVAGVVAGNATGQCPTCLLLPIRAAELFSVAPQSMIAEAIEYAVAQGADVIYVGFAGPEIDLSLESALQAAESAGILVVAPAGNGLLDQTFHPAASESVVSVVATNEERVQALITNSGGFEDVAAPGEFVATTKLGGGSEVRSGSSVAAAYVAGVAARLLQLNPMLTTDDLRHILRNATEPLASPAFYQRFDYGILEPQKAESWALDSTLVDARIARVSVIPRKPLVGQVASAQVTVVNAGNSALTGASLTGTWAGAPITPVVVPSLAAGERTVVSVGLFAVGAAHVLDLALQPAGDVDIANGLHSETVDVVFTADHNVDILIGDLEVSAPAAGFRTASYSYVVRNLGNTDTSNIGLEVFAKGSSLGGPAPFPLAVGGEQSGVASWVFPDSTEDKQARLEVRASLLSNTDSDPSDNAWGHRFHVSTVSALMTLAYADAEGPNIITDAPWVTTRDYIPLLVFVPESAPGGQINEILVTSYDPSVANNTGAASGEPFLRDNRNDEDDVLGEGLTFIDPLGVVRGDFSQNDEISDFWHYVIRIPFDYPNFPEEHTDGFYYVLTAISFDHTRWTGFRTDPVWWNKVLRFRRGNGFPSFDPADTYYDAHVHTIAEQTVDRAWTAPQKNFGGPLIMLMEASYAMGLVSQQPNADWAATKDRLVVTDHNVFYSRTPHDPGEDGALASAPGFGPTAETAGVSEPHWYRQNLGRLAGEEVALQSGSNQTILPPQGPLPDRGDWLGLEIEKQNFIGHHFLVYDTAHIPGPWHGGDLLGNGVPNPNTMVQVLTMMKAENTTGFGYAAHPLAPGLEWPSEYFDRAIGFPMTTVGGVPNNGTMRPHAHQTDFYYKGAQVWNRKAVWRGKQQDFDPELLRNIRPWGSNGNLATTFETNPDWHAELNASLVAYFTRVARGLNYYFHESPDQRFHRKIYMTAGSDAHGDFNYTDDVLATRLGEANVDSNAYGVVRTYVLAHDRPGTGAAAIDRHHDAYRDGNTVLTDGPICAWWLDSSGRHNPEAIPRWHDATEAFENKEGRIGGVGNFDGGRTLLVPDNGYSMSDSVFARTRWGRSESPGAGDIFSFDWLRIKAPPAPDDPTGLLGAGMEGVDHDTKLPTGSFSFDTGSEALVASASTEGGVEEQCIMNPIWVAPVAVVVQHPTVCPIPAQQLNVSFRFPISMKDQVTGTFVSPLDGNGNSTHEIALISAPGWQKFNGVDWGRYDATNPDPIPCPDADWDARDHEVEPGKQSYVVYMKQPTDYHGNVLNDIGETFVLGEDASLTFWGTAEGGTIGFSVDGIPLQVVTTAGQTAAEVAQVVAAAINLDSTLSGMNIGAFVNGSEVTTSGVVTNIEINDPGLNIVAVPSQTFVSRVVLLLLLLVAGATMLESRRAQEVAAPAPTATHGDLS